MNGSRISLALVILSGWIFLSALAVTPQAWGCMICVPYPQKTLTDRLLENADLIFAREVSGSPYQFLPAEIIRGSSSVAPFKLFCNSSTRRKLRVIPDSAVVLGRTDSTEDWKVLTFADVEYQSFIRSIMQESSSWGDHYKNQGRVEFFTGFLTSRHEMIQEQAFLELGRAPYTTIKRMAAAVATQRIYALLENYQFVEWHSLYILLLGQSRTPRDHRYIRGKVESLARSRTTINLAAWLTAFIESHPEDGVEQIESWYFTKKGRSREELEAVLSSMTVLGSQQPDFEMHIPRLRREIVGSYSTLLEQYPAMAGNVARILTMWQINAHTDKLSAILEEHGTLDPASSSEISYYLNRSGHFTRVVPGQ